MDCTDIYYQISIVVIMWQLHKICIFRKKYVFFFFPSSKLNDCQMRDRILEI